METTRIRAWLLLVLLAQLTGDKGMAEERHENFDKDPGWEGHNNRLAKPELVRQDFGWSPGTTNAGGAPGEIGGWISPAAEPAYFAKKIKTQTLNDVLMASGSFVAEKGRGHTLIGFFNAQTLNEWRTPNTITLRIQQRGEILHCHVEHCTGKWRSGAGIIGKYDKARDRMEAKELRCGQAYAWSLKYEPNGAKGGGIVTATVGEDIATYELSPDHRSDGALFDHFGIVNVMKQFDNPGHLWLDNVIVNGEREEFSNDPQWEEFGNRRTYETRSVRPRFDFGFSPTAYAGGKSAGELGGLFFRGDCRYPERLAAYGDRLALLTLNKPLKASGKVALRRGVTDSTTLLGFYHSEHSLRVNQSQDLTTPRNFLGVAVEGPSAEGFYFYPVYRTETDDTASGVHRKAPRIYPNGATHDWTLEYDPAGSKHGTITVTLDGQSTQLDLAAGTQKMEAKFDRFGLITPWIDGNGQIIYFDDLSYTSKQD